MQRGMKLRRLSSIFCGRQGHTRQDGGLYAEYYGAYPSIIPRRGVSPPACATRGHAQGARVSISKFDGAGTKLEHVIYNTTYSTHSTTALCSMRVFASTWDEPDEAGRSGT